MARALNFKKWLSSAGLSFLLWAGIAPVDAWAEERPRATHTVRSGDVLSVIAEERGVSLMLLRKVNRLGDADTIQPGQMLLLPRIHVVKSGEVLGVIAERHGVRVQVLYEHNDLTQKSILRVGQRLVIPGGYEEPSRPGPEASAQTPTQAKGPAEKQAKGPAEKQAKGPAEKQAPNPEAHGEYYEHEVRAGEVLSTIAERYALPTEQLRQLNQLSKRSVIRIGQRLKIPVTEKNRRLTRPEPPKPWQKYARAKFRPGYVTLQSPGRKWSGQALDKQGKIRSQARRGMQSMLGSWAAGRRGQMDSRLLQMIVQVSDEFGGRPIRVVSGFRKHSYSPHSRHPLGRALDFSIPGVPNSAIVDFLLTLPNTGVGYYPNSTHVHMDTRSHRMHWVDVSGPGQAPRYVHKSTTGERAPVAHERTVKRTVRESVGHLARR